MAEIGSPVFSDAVTVRVRLGIEEKVFCALFGKLFGV
jgi:hypothetical protein